MSSDEKRAALSKHTLTEDTFVFRKYDRIGRADAEEDHEFLEACFVETGDLTILRDCSDSRRIVIGRTGAGKTALLKQLDGDSRAIRIEPENLALEYVSNSTILRFLSGIGVKFDIFFKLLWRHVFAVEILQKHFQIRDENSKRSVLATLAGFFKENKNKEAWEYLEEWGGSFWKETDYRIKEVTKKLEEDLRAGLSATKFPLSFSLEGAQALSTEEKREIVERAQDVINKVQIRKLSQVLSLLDQVLNDPQKRYYVLIDRLDENWVGDELRYPLIRALIETCRDFRKVQHAKIIVALRVDLVERVFKVTRDAGFQEEKYEDLFLNLVWSAEKLTEVLDARINHLFRLRYRSRSVTYEDLLPTMVGGVPAMEYILERTLMRPRDVILFFNECISRSQNTAKISPSILRQAEVEYSRGRLKSLRDEWHADYPNLLRFTALLKNERGAFSITDFSDTKVTDFALDFGSNPGVQDDLSDLAVQLVDCVIDSTIFKRRLFEVFHRVGLVGVKLESFESVVWSHNGKRVVAADELCDATRIYIHPCFHRALGIFPTES